MKRTIIGTLTLLLLLAAGNAAHAQTMKLGEVLIVNAPELKPDADVKAFEAHVAGVLAPAWSKNAPGMDLTLVRKDRGSHAGQYLLVWTADTVARSKGYASTSGDNPFAPALNAKVGDFRAGLAPFVTSGGKFIEYHLVSPEKVGPLPTIDILAIHFVKVRPDRVEAFDRFVSDKLHAAVGNLRPDLRLLYYKPVRGDAPGNYMTVFALTKASRDKYWPKGSDSDDVRAAFSPSVTALTSELSTYLVEGAYATGALAAAVFESKEWADWNLVPAPAR